MFLTSPSPGEIKGRASVEVSLRVLVRPRRENAEGGRRGPESPAFRVWAERVEERSEGRHLASGQGCWGWRPPKPVSAGRCARPPAR